MLIIFDCDGVLVDSEYLSSEIFSSTLEKVGIEMSATSCYQQFQGQSLVNCFRWIEETFDCRLPDDFGALLERETAVGFEGRLQPVKGIENVLSFLQKNSFSYCVASNGGHAKIEHSLKLTNLFQFFDRRFSVDDVARGKPAPDLFLYAAKTMGYAPEDVLVIEDSQAGWEGANGAGMDVLVFAPGGKPGFPCEKSFSEMEYLLEVFAAVNTN